MERPPPNLVMKTVLWVTSFLRWLADALTPPHALLMSNLTAFVGSSMIFEAANLGITEAIGDDKHWVPIDALATELGLDERILLRLLRALYQRGCYLLKTRNGIVYVRNNAMSMALHPDAKSCMKYMAIHQGKHVMPAFNDPNGGLDHAMRSAHDNTKPTAFAKKFGLAPMGWIKQNPESAKIINKAMISVDSMGVGAMVEDHDWGQYKRIYDTGGGTGHFLFNILQFYKQIQEGIVADLPQPIEQGRRQFEEKCKITYKGNETTSEFGALKPRVQFLTIDLFNKETLPRAKDGDCFMLRNVFHDFVDKDVKVMLSNLRAAMGKASATLAIVEGNPELKARNSLEQAITTIDMIMLVLNCGGGRTPSEWQRLFSETGFSFRSCTPTRSQYSVTIAVPA